MKRFIEPVWSGIYSYPPYQRYGPVARCHYIIHYVVSGKGYFTVDGVTHEIEGGRAFIIYKGDVAEYHADRSDPWHYVWLDLDGEMCEALLAKTGFSKERRVSAPLSAKRLLPLFAEIRESFAAEGAELKALAAVIELVAAIAEEFPPAETRPSGKTTAERAMALINRNYRSSDCRIDKIGAILGVSRSQLYRAFVAHYGISPKEYLDGLRIDRARHVLAEGKTSVADVCYSSGFTDPLYFSALFKRRTGTSPSAYRKSFRTSGDDER